MAEKSKAELLKETREAATALLEDFEHLEELCQIVETKPADLRRASVILRRWLVENELGRVAGPRVGRLNLQAIDNNPVYRAQRNGQITSFLSGGAQIHGVFAAGMIVSEGSKQPDIAGYHPDNLIQLRLDTFTKQRVIYSKGEWFTRQQVIKFVANADRGVHGHGPRDVWERQLSQFRTEIAVSTEIGTDGNARLSIQYKVGRPANEVDPEKYDPKKVHGVLIELLSTMGYLVTSPEVIALVKVIREEIS